MRSIEEKIEIARPMIEQLDKLNERVFKEDPRRNGARDDFQRDYTRIMYSSSFRRLQGKMQLLGLERDAFFRNRLTHSLEVSQIARALAESLGYENTYPVESAALAHDIGNPPFGHYGEKVLNKIANDIGGFEGNAQAHRVLTHIEKKNHDTQGLNLTIRTLLSITKYYVDRGEKDSKIKKFIYKDDYENLKGYIDMYNIKMRTLDAQIMDIADEIAYAAHDLEDGLSMNLFTINDIMYEYETWFQDKSKESYSKFKEIVSNSTEIAKKSNTFNSSEEFSIMIRKELLGNIVNCLINDIDFCKVDDKSRKETGSNNEFELGFKRYGEMAKALKKITFNCINKGDNVQLYEKKGEIILYSLYNVYMDDKFNKNNILLPPEYRIDEEDLKMKKRFVIDYISGMMDSFAISTYEKFYGKKSLENLYKNYVNLENML